MTAPLSTLPSVLGGSVPPANHARLALGEKPRPCFVVAFASSYIVYDETRPSEEWKTFVASVLLLALAAFALSGCGGTTPKNPDIVPRTQEPRNEKEKKVFVEMAKLFNMQGLEACEKGAYEEAIRHFQKAIEKDDLPAYLNNLGRAFYWTGRYDAALEAYTKAREKSPNDAELLVNIADVYRQKKDTPRAIELYHEALNINPDFARAHFELADLYMKQGQYESAEYRLKKTLELDPANNRALLSRAILFHMTGRSREAWRDIQILDRRGFKVQDGFRREVLDRLGLSDEGETTAPKARQAR